MINLQLAVVFLVDAIELILIFTLILGFSFRKGKRYYAAAIAMVICCVFVILGLQNPSNRIFFTLAAHVLMAVALFDGKITVVGELAALAHFLIGIIDSLCTGTMMLFFHGQRLTSENMSLFNVISGSGGIIILLTVIFFCYKKREKVRKHLDLFNLKKFVYYFLYIIVSSVIIGYAGLAVIDAGIVYRLRAALVIGSSLFSILIIVSGIMIDALLLQRRRLAELVRENVKCIDEQTKQYISLNKKQSELRKFRHDYNAHMLALQRLSEGKETEKLHQYISNMQDLRKSFDLINTNHVIGDAVINEFYEKCREEKIEMKVTGRFPDKLLLSETDMCIVLSNVVENAYEATRKCKEKRKILISIEAYQNRVFITIENPVKEAPVIKDGLPETSKLDRENHGIGLKNVCDVIERNNGDFQMKCEKGIVRTELSI